MVNNIIMEKKKYIAPLNEVTELGALSRLMKDLGGGSLPAHAGAPQRRTEVF